jgi:MFS family permease
LLSQHRHLLGVLGIVAVISFFGRPYARLMPALAREVLHVGPTGLGLLQAAPAIGTILAVFIIAAIGETAQKGSLLITAVIAAGAMGMLVGLSTWFAASLGLLALVGISQALAMATANTLVQTSVQPNQRGRVMGLYGMVTFGMVALGTMPLGALAGAIGVGYALAAGGAAVIVLVGLIALTVPRITRL